MKTLLKIQVGIFVWFVFSFIMRSIFGKIPQIVSVIYLILIVSWMIAPRMIVYIRQWRKDRKRSERVDQMNFVYQLVSYPQFASHITKQFKFALYLRPFYIDRSAKIRGGPYKFEELLEDTIEKWMTLVAIGGTREIGESGSIKVNLSNQDWQRHFRIFVRTAKLIFVVPSYTEATFWEFQYLCDQRLWSKVIFMMPPTDDYHLIDIGMHWDKTNDAYLKAGVELPTFTKDGLLFRLDDNNKVYCKVPIDLKNILGCLEAIEPRFLMIAQKNNHTGEKDLIDTAFPE